MPDLAELSTRFDTYHGEVKDFHKRTMKNFEKASGFFDKVGERLQDIGGRLTEVEQKMSRTPSDPSHFVDRTPGEIVINDEEFKAAQAVGARWRGKVSIEVKTITSASTSGGSLVAPDVQTTPFMLPRRRLRIRDLVAPGQTTSNSVWWPRQTSRTNAAATVAENPAAPKPQSDLAFEQVQNNVQTLATWIKASKQVMDDAPVLAGMVDGELRYMLADVEDRQLLTGDGTGTNLKGIVPQATPYAKPTGTAFQNGTMIDTLLAAMAQVELSDYEADGLVMHPVDWANLMALKDTQNRYLAASPVGPLIQALWTLPIVRTRIMIQGQFLIGAFSTAAQIFDRKDANVLVSTEDQDNFVKNMVTVLAEERLAFVVKRSTAFVTGALAPI